MKCGDVLKWLTRDLPELTNLTNPTHSYKDSAKDFQTSRLPKSSFGFFTFFQRESALI